MKKISRKEYYRLHRDYRGVYSSDMLHGTNLNGRRTMLTFEEGQGTVLLIEGESFEITNI